MLPRVVSLLALLTCLTYVTADIGCLKGSFTEIDNEFTVEPVETVTCKTGFCQSAYYNDGQDITYVLDCAPDGVTAEGCKDDFGKSTKTCYCKTDLCTHVDAGSPVEFSLKDITMSSATAAYQVEGATDIDGRGPSIWDLYQKRPGVIRHNDTADVGCDSYHLWKDDVKLLSDMGVDQYRFSISWTRILTDGTVATNNSLGIAYYHKLIDALIAEKIEPVVTMYHWDLPQGLMDQGGWLNQNTAKVFGEYAAFLLEEYGDKVKKWIPINEPVSVSQFEYCGDTHSDAPGNFIPHCAWSMYLAAANMIRGHTEAWKAYKALNETNPDKYADMTFGIALSGPWYYAGDDKNETQKGASIRSFEFYWGLYAHPLIKGGWSDFLIEQIGNLSIAEGRKISRLPVFSDEEIKDMTGSVQFLGVNYYNSLMARSLEAELPANRWAHTQEDYDAAATGDWLPAWRSINASNGWIVYTPSGLRLLLNHIKEQYDNIPVLITENGCMDTCDEGRQDNTRIHYLRGHLIAISQAKHVDGVNVIGYTLWSLMDNFEWLDGFTTKFGIHEVDFNSPNRTRTPKASAGFFKNAIAKRSVEGFLINSRY
uniref:Beta-glucosidase n=1 Tax=Panagrellus redivivus TaxID=6233 RepID=A0A7E4VAN4_PANRE